ncbi:hypothetical protein ACLMJK_000023 [Lecanora helva]
MLLAILNTLIGGLVLLVQGEELRNATSGFTQSTSSGKLAQCTSANVTIPITTTNTKILLSEPNNQSVVSGLIQELVEVESSLVARVSGGQSVFRGSYRISLTLCYPARTKATTQIVQVLTNGAGFDKSYWDIAPGFSYVDAAAQAGYATVAYDRLGVGDSEYPDALQTVQCPADIEILHGIVRLLRTVGFASQTFKWVIGVGHSYGSIVQLAHNARYPRDVDASILTGFTSNLVDLPYTTMAFNPCIAKGNDPAKFGALSNGYLVHDTRISIQLPYFRYPFYSSDSKLTTPQLNIIYEDFLIAFENVYASKSTYSLGQLLTLPNILGPAPAFSGPVDIVVGQQDFPFCLGNCSFPRDQAAATIPALYPAANPRSTHYILPDSGHLINAHYSAPKAFAQMNEFLRLNGF